MGTGKGNIRRGMEIENGNMKKRMGNAYAKLEIPIRIVLYGYQNFEWETQIGNYYSQWDARNKKAKWE